MAGPVEHVPARWAVAAPAAGDHTGIEIHAVDEATFLLRQSKRTSAEAPILVLLLGTHRALLLDTGDGAEPAAFPLRGTVDGLVGAWLDVNPRDGYGLVVAHSHAHGDHVAGDGQFAGRTQTQIVGLSPSEVRAFFGGEDTGGTRSGARASGADDFWRADLDLGARELIVLATPGHHSTSITIYDRATELLLTGDTVYPGRLYVDDLPRFVTSLQRLAAFASEHTVSAVVGAHIEMSRTPGRDYALRARSQPDEAPLALPPTVLGEVLDAAREMAAKGAGRVTRDQFVVIDETRRSELLRLALRARWHALLGRNRLP